MEDHFKNITMREVASLAEVSIGTVDRVIHGRGGVSEKKRKKVCDAIEQLGYKTNVHASVLSRKQRFSIIVVIPYFQPGSYWELVYNGVMKAAAEVERMNIEVKIFYYNQFDIESFKAACRNMVDATPDAICMAPIYKKETIYYLNHLSKLATPIVYIDTKLDNTKYLAYYGMPMFESGYLAAHLLTGEIPADKIAVFNLDGRMNTPNDSFKKRRLGFADYIDKFNNGCELIDVQISPDDFMLNIRIFDEFFEKNPDVNHIVTFNSRAYMIASWLELRGVSSKKFVGYDMLPANLDLLKKGYISMLICERTDIEAYNAMMSLADYLLLNKAPLRQDQLSPLDILTKYNVDFYL